MATLRAFTAAALLLTGMLLPLHSAQAKVPDYKLGDVATEDVITPVPLQVVNPEATEALKQKVAQQVLFIVRLTPQSAGEAERDLRDSIAAARSRFLSALQRAQNGRAPTEADVDTPAYAITMREMVREFPKDLPFERLAPYWVRGSGDDFFIEGLLQPVREVMAQPIVSGKTENPMPTNQNVRLLPVKSVTEMPPAQELENAGTSVSAGQGLSASGAHGGWLKPIFLPVRKDWAAMRRSSCAPTPTPIRP